ncbi:hypothetical protein ACQKKX_09810 [Neorhizobium sp. NPDC001467]|uniref:hypothetical protein n=1 Tax=Neorhizobium sp. NPDC001467 TaxID=3390595 RepID=UPI003D014BE0
MSAFTDLLSQPAVTFSAANVETAQVDDDELYVIIGTQSAQAAAERSFDFLATRTKLIEIGKAAFRNLEKAVHRLVCQRDDNDADTNAAIDAIVGAITKKAAAALALALVGTFSLPQLVATAVAILLIRLLGRATSETICEVWKPLESR